MSISLEKGQSVSLTKNNPGLSRIKLGLGWDVNKEKKKGILKTILGYNAFDLDASALVLKEGKLYHTIYYGNRGSKQSPVYHHGDNLTGAGDGDDEVISVNLDKLEDGIDRIIFIVNIYSAKARNQSFKQIQNAFIRLVNEDTREELLRYDLSGGSIDDCTALIFADIHKDADGWHFSALGEGSTADSIGEISSRYK